MSERFAHQAVVNGVAFDQKSGLGNTPLNQDIDYFGMAVMMKPSTFLKLAAAISKFGHNTVGLSYIKTCLTQGTRPIASPFLVISKDDDGYRVVGHEGRHRMKAILETLGDVEIPVHLESYWTRARNLTPEDVAGMRARMRREKSTDVVEGPLFGDAWLNGVVLSAEEAPEPAAVRP